MAVSVIHIGLPLDHPSIPASERPKIEARLNGFRETMRDAGYLYEIHHASPDTGLEEFRERLRTGPCDAVLIGGGVMGNTDLIFFLEQLVNTAHEEAPKAKILFFDHSVDVKTSVERWFKPRA